MNKKIPTALALAIIAALVTAFGCWVYFGDTYIKQQRRMKIGREYLPVLTNLVYSHSEFRDVDVVVGTAKTGCFLVTGILDKGEQFSNLQSVIASAKPPLDVVYRIKVLEYYAEVSPANTNGAASQSQLAPAQTNQTLPAAGSGGWPQR